MQQYASIEEEIDCTNFIIVIYSDNTFSRRYNNAFTRGNKTILLKLAVSGRNNISRESQYIE